MLKELLLCDTCGISQSHNHKPVPSSRKHNKGVYDDADDNYGSSSQTE
jgi:hypothetical protein